MTVTLEGYDWWNDQEAARAWTPDPHKDARDPRSPFERDRARIIHSVGFRRLQGKTQIFAPSSADFLRTRVTHSIEVAQIGRALAQRFRVDDSLVEAACLGHDLGHPPFGHTGEHVLAELMGETEEHDDYGSFEGNAQTFRLVTYLEEKAADYPGLDLCRATLHGLLKYPYTRGADHKKFLYDDDVDRYEGFLFEDRPGGFQTSYKPDADPPRSLPCQLMDWADDIAYSVHDLEDGIASGMLNPALWRNDWFLESVVGALAKAPGVRWKDGPPSAEVVEPVVRDLCDRLSDEEPPIPLDVIRDQMRHYIDKFATAGTLVETGDGSSLFDFKLDIPEEIRIENQILKSITFEYVIDDATTRRQAFKGQEILRRLFAALLENTQQSGRDRLLLFPREQRPRLDTLSEVEAARAVCDYLAGMTEGQALRLYAQLFEPSAGAAPGHV
jgi:dGTPase